MKTQLFSILFAFFLFSCASEDQKHDDASSDWKPAENPLFSRWAKEISPDDVHRAYPRPTMVRERWENLNGLWKYAITEGKSGMPATFDDEILVPFPIESALSGVKRMIKPQETLWYQRQINIPSGWGNDRVLLHFGAVDWHARIYLNGKMLAEHKGGYDPFTVDISEALGDQQGHTLVVEVQDPTDQGPYPRGKQTLDPQGIWYTPTTGIWRTVWLEPVPQNYLNRLKLTPDIDNQQLIIEPFVNGETAAYTIEAIAMDGDTEVATMRGSGSSALEIKLEEMKLWSPERPHLYDLRVNLYGPEGDKVDEVESYFGMRKVAVDRGPDGHNRIFLNNEPLFQLGPLDQGFWPGGLYTAPSDEALKYDVQVTKDMGFNMIRKHVKIEPERWYYWCDKLGLLVWQDMPSGDEEAFGSTGEIKKDEEAAKQFEAELKEMIDDYYNHPSIVMWVIFNEGWGQYEAARHSSWAQDYDPGRLINAASGWLDMGPQVGDVKDIHKYPGPAMPDLEPVRVAVLGEFGGQALPLDGHLWVTDLEKAPTHFNTSKTGEELTAEYKELYEKLEPMSEKGLAGAVYTQTTDIESEVNGLLTYDREIVKMDIDTLRSIHQNVIHQKSDKP